MKKRYIVLILLILVLLWFVYPLISFYSTSFWYDFLKINNSVDWDNSAKFGDSFGGLNSLLSGFALLGIIYSINIQRKELKNNKLELENQRKEFQINRITNVIYYEIRKFNDCVKKFEYKEPYFSYEADLRGTITEPKTKYNLYEGENALKEILRVFKSFIDKNEKDSDLNKKNDFVKNFLSTHIAILYELSHQVSNTCQIFDLTVRNEEISLDNKRELKRLLIINLGLNFKRLITVICNYTRRLGLNFVEHDIGSDDSGLKLSIDHMNIIAIMFEIEIFINNKLKDNY
jgi:hypothetical protein